MSFQQREKWVTKDGTQVERYVENGYTVTVVGDPKAGEEEMYRWYEGWLSRKYGGVWHVDRTGGRVRPAEETRRRVFEGYRRAMTRTQIETRD